MMSERRSARAASPVQSLKEVDSGLTGGWQPAGSLCLTALQIFGLKQEESRQHRVSQLILQLQIAG